MLSGESFSVSPLFTAPPLHGQTAFRSADSDCPDNNKTLYLHSSAETIILTVDGEAKNNSREEVDASEEQVFLESAYTKVLF